MASPGSETSQTRRKLGRAPSQLKQALQEHKDFAPFGPNMYNEMVVSTASVVERLPASVEAFFYVGGTSTHGDKVDVNAVHQRFVRETHAVDVPLLRLDPANWETPFEVTA